jgi:hypothetical protein
MLVHPASMGLLPALVKQHGRFNARTKKHILIIVGQTTSARMLLSCFTGTTGQQAAPATTIPVPQH